MTAVHQTLAALFERDGELSATQVVAEASDPESPLHTHFEWDDSAAAIQYRLEQARGLIRSCRLTIETRPEMFTKVRAFVNVPSVGYVPTEDALADSEQRDVVLQQCRREIAALRRKYQALVDFDAALAESLKPDVAA